MKGNTPSGILLLDKEVGISSRKCLDSIAKKLHFRGLGHAGTLDPLASGLLIILTGNAKKLQDIFTCHDKLYRTTIFLGAYSETDDGEGPIHPYSVSSIPLEREIKDVITSFTGEISQIPPSYSAIKIQGKRAYSLARKGKKVELKSRTISIYNIKLIQYNFPELEIEVSCSTGTYIRSLARDIGEALGTKAYVKTLRRLESGSFKIQQAETVENIERSSLYPLEFALASYNKIELPYSAWYKIQHGQKISYESQSLINPPYFIWINNQVVALAKIGKSCISTKKLLTSHISPLSDEEAS